MLRREMKWSKRQADGLTARSKLAITATKTSSRSYIITQSTKISVSFSSSHSQRKYGAVEYTRDNKFATCVLVDAAYTFNCEVERDFPACGAVGVEL